MKRVKSFINLDDGEKSGVNMGASGNNPKSAKLATLLEKKKALEEALSKRNMELKQLCIQEAELTGVMPPEIPIEAGESPPQFRRKVYTLYQLPQKLVDNFNNNKQESIIKLELALQVQAKLAEAALGLASENNLSKVSKRTHFTLEIYCTLC